MVMIGGLERTKEKGDRGEFQNTAPFHLEVGYFCSLTGNLAKSLWSIPTEPKLFGSLLYLYRLCNSIGVISYLSL